TCSHHGGVNYWGADLQRISQATWPGENSLFFFILAAALVGWYGYGVRALHRKHATDKKLSTSTHLQRQCCTNSLAEGLSYCSTCGAALTNAVDGAAVSPAIIYTLVTATAFLTIGIAVVAFLYFRTRQTAAIAASA